MNYHSKSSQPINKHLNALITFIALLPLVYYVPDIVGPFLPSIKWLNVVIVVAIIVPIISYGVIPLANVILSNRKESIVKKH